MKQRADRATASFFRKKSNWALVGIFFANALEWFDFVAFGYFASVLGDLFFPTGSQIASISLTFATFGITFLVRPLGAVVLGAYADRQGRKSALVLSAALMTFGTAVIAVLPTYSSVGLMAPVLLVVARTVQGFSAGGEFGSATTYLAEYSSSNRGFFSSLQFSSQGFTALLATSIGFLLTSFLSVSDLEIWGWRVPFLFGALIGPLTYFIRLHAVEPAGFHATESPIKEFAANGKKRALISVAAVTLGTVVTYTIVFLPTYTSVYLGFSAYYSFLGALTTAIVLVVFTPVAGALSDRIGRFATMYPPAIMLLTFSYPGFAWLSAAPSFARLLVVHFFIGILAAWYLGALPGLMSKLFPSAYRSTGLSVSYAVAVSGFGGFAPLIIAWLIQITGSDLAPSFYLIFAAIISLLGLHAARRLGVG